MSGVQRAKWGGRIYDLRFVIYAREELPINREELRLAIRPGLASFHSSPLQFRREFILMSFYGHSK